MIPLLRSVLFALLWDELAAKRWLRGGLLAIATGGLAFADQLAAELGTPLRWVRIAAIVAGFIAGAISHGEPNPKPDPTP